MQPHQFAVIITHDLDIRSTFFVFGWVILHGNRTCFQTACSALCSTIIDLGVHLPNNWWNAISVATISLCAKKEIYSSAAHGTNLHG